MTEHMVFILKIVMEIKSIISARFGSEVVKMLTYKWQ